jgi:hypothetical protein
MLSRSQTVNYFNGMGEKMANCIRLDGLHKSEAFQRDLDTSNY